ncbi:endothelin-converting enzyme homolog [Adelges cooleyi]|uniref:endothelin-converting enzyme homolog n=1 Tax=Adelges cooleyi TaxID=133065 RepID=UPI0021806F08|nr:endothelin-converting enzyme homolog [Adelges cooleyi]XP_050440647.1 endothelin-converting enzyme homolog [Adelges cooleyi]
MAHYKHKVFEEETSSMGSVHLTEGVTTSSTHIRFYTGKPKNIMSKWKNRTLLEKILLVVCFTTTTLLIITFFKQNGTDHYPNQMNPVEVYEDTGSDNAGQEYCLSETCVFTASLVLRGMDKKSDPCQDFYKYACGQWIKSNPVPDGRSMWGMFNELEMNNQLVVKNALEALPPNYGSKAELKAKMYFTACMDPNDTIEALGAKPLNDLLDNIGGWNISGSWNMSTWKLQRTLETLHNQYNMPGLFYWIVGEDDRNSSRHIIQIDEGGLTLPARDCYLNKTANQKLLDTYLEYMTTIGTLLGGEPNATRAQMKDVIEFESRLAEFTEPDENKRDEEKAYHLMSISELQNLAPFIQWNHYFNSAFRYVNRKITNKENVVVYSPSFLANVSKLIDEYSKSPENKTVINNYLIWQTVRTVTPYLSKVFRDAYKGLRKVLLGSEGGEEPWRYCISDTNNVLGFALGALYVRDVFHGQSKKLAEEMINEIRTSFKENFKNLDWMDKETLIEAEKKADAITDMIGFPDYIMDSNQLDEKYQNLTVRPDEYFMNNIRAIKFNLEQYLVKLDQPTNRTRWSMTPPTVNAYYTPTKNQIVFPAGILQAPFFEQLQQPSVNFGAMGVVMGHELTHAFDDQGREFDRFGNLHQWWNNKTVEKFKTATDCMIKQYSNYKINGININGKRTLGENIADNGGLKAAYRAYAKRLEEGRAHSYRLPAVHLTTQQLFFVSFAQVWCSSSTDASLKLQIEKDLHSPSQYRVNGPLSNLEEFSKVYNCELGTPMNPEEKCIIW